ncbi:MAG: ASPIC/UnbV domain-containing protein [Chloroflexota bacterium]
MQREVRVASGYLSGDPARMHFGLPADTELEMLEIRWPDGTITQIDTLEPQTLLQITLG